MNKGVQHAKLKGLVHVCMKTGNYKKIAVVYFVFIRNRINKIGMKLGIREYRGGPEKLFEYMKLINEVFMNNMDVEIFPNHLVKNMIIFGNLFMKKEGNLSYEKVKDLVKLFYELEKIKPLNVHKVMDDDVFSNNSQMKMLSLFSPAKRKGKDLTSNLKQFMLYKMKETENSYKSQLKQGYNKGILEKAMEMKSLRNSLKTENKGKIQIQGTLKNNINYQRSINEIIGYFVFGLFVLFLMLGVAVVWEAMSSPYATASLGPLILLFLGPSFLFFFIYKVYFKEGV